jgi:hypothetical protein
LRSRRRLDRFSNIVFAYWRRGCLLIAVALLVLPRSFLFTGKMAVSAS